MYIYIYIYNYTLIMRGSLNRGPLKVSMIVATIRIYVRIHIFSARHPGPIAGPIHRAMPSPVKGQSVRSTAQRLDLGIPRARILCFCICLHEWSSA